MQRASQIIFFILPRRDHTFLLPTQLPVRTDFGVKMDIHFIFIKDRMLCAAFVQYFMDCCHLFIFMRVTDTQGWRSPAPYKSRRRQRERVLPARVTVCRYAQTASGGHARQVMISVLQHPTA